MSLLSRFLMFLFIGLAVGIAALWISGGKRDEYSTEIEIQRSRSQVFPFLIKPDSIKQWMNEIDYIDEPLPPKEENSYAVSPKLTRIHKSADGVRTEFSDTVIRYKQDETLTVQSVNGGIKVTTILQLDDAENKSTRVRYDVLVARSSLARLMAPLQKSEIQTRINQEIGKLKALVEKNTTLATPEKEADSAQVPQEGKTVNQSSRDVSGDR